MPAPTPAGDELEEVCVEVVSAVLDQYRPRLLAAALAGERHPRDPGPARGQEQART